MTAPKPLVGRDGYALLTTACISIKSNKYIVWCRGHPPEIPTIRAFNRRLPALFLGLLVRFCAYNHQKTDGGSECFWSSFCSHCCCSWASKGGMQRRRKGVGRGGKGMRNNLDMRCNRQRFLRPAFVSHFCLVNASFDVILRKTVCSYISY